jgi:hypothetical protein
LATALTLGSGCTDASDTGVAPGAASTQPTESSESPPAVGSAKDFDPGTFGSSTTVDNAWFPLPPGTRWAWEGHALDEGDRIRRRVVITVTDMTKVIDGVRTLVTLDLDFNDGEMIETELAFFAQDDGGNVWHFGEYPEEYEEGEFVKAPAWIHGFQGARAGLIMKADATVDTGSYAQGWGPKIGWDDRAEVFATGQETCTPFDCFQDVLVMREYSRSIPGASQLKFYADGVGTVRVGWKGAKEEEREVLELVSFERLSPEELAKVRAEVLAQEGRAYERSPDVYGPTGPMEPLGA